MDQERTPEQLALRRQIRLDMIVDTLGNIALALGLWGWFGEAGTWSQLWHEPAVFVGLTATGTLNLVHLPKRLRRLKQWQQSKNQ